jgi:formylmethanofuran dehydrogenase subunit E
MPETLMITTFTCDHCKEEKSIDQCTEFDGKMLCEQCLRNETCICDSCGERLWRDDNQGSDSITLCSYCREDHYYRCTDCGCLIHREDVRYINSSDDSPHCENCYDDHEDDDEEDLQYIHPYSHKPEPIFYGNGVYYGIEIEVGATRS